MHNSCFSLVPVADNRINHWQNAALYVRLLMMWTLAQNITSLTPQLMGPGIERLWLCAKLHL